MELVLLEVDNIPAVETRLEVVVGEKHNLFVVVEAPDFPAIQDFANHFHTDSGCSLALFPSFPAALTSYDAMGHILHDGGIFCNHFLIEQRLNDCESGIGTLMPSAKDGAAEKLVKMSYIKVDVEV
ncbi:MAG: hypothetical protein AUH05_08875 [Ktedonobacter sp. 13_2_20CM_53_11]|nr:MAG: hypothetical protein AUH05_08875 [Ktedonobacter sp. 13_2_20CM_53_11]